MKQNRESINRHTHKMSSFYDRDTKVIQQIGTKTNGTKTIRYPYAKTFTKTDN